MSRISKYLKKSLSDSVMIINLQNIHFQVVDLCDYGLSKVIFRSKLKTRLF